MFNIYSVTSVIVWLIGILFAQGFWSTLFACLVPFYAWYLVVERLFIMNGWI